MSDDSGEVRRPDVWSELFPGRFIKADLFKGKRVTLTITDVVLEKLPDEVKGEQTRGILSFQQTPMQLAINKTNGLCLRAMFGDRPPSWVGKRVTFQSELDSFGKLKVDAVRIYGSPDIDQDVEVEVKMPKRKAKVRRLVKVGAATPTPDTHSQEEEKATQ